eukprot:scaffold66128_cov55-Attheya_sp.AAC.1
MERQEDGLLEEAPYIMKIPDVIMSADSMQTNEFPTESYNTLALAAVIGVCSGVSVALFKLSIDAVEKVFYDSSIVLSMSLLVALIPALGGLVVGILRAVSGPFPPGLGGTVNEIDQESLVLSQAQIQEQINPLRFLQKAVASIATLGTGASLGPEGPSVEVGMAMSRLCMHLDFNLLPTVFSQQQQSSGQELSREATAQRNRLLLSCGAASGLSAGFNAPIAGVFFALEIVQAALPPLPAASISEWEDDGEITMGKTQPKTTTTTTTTGPISAAPGAMSSILLSSVLAALVSRMLLGEQLALSLSEYTLKTPLLELPLYLLLGAMCGLVAFAFRQSVSVGSGLVGGTFAPSLFFGAMVGASFHNLMAGIFETINTNPQFSSLVGPILDLADVPAYAMVGAASVLAALFRAPLTASLLLFELTRDYDVILPLMASAGVGSLVSDIVENKMKMLAQEKISLSLERDLSDSSKP